MDTKTYPEFSTNYPLLLTTFMKRPVRYYPDQIGVVYRNHVTGEYQRFTWREWYQRVCQLAHALQDELKIQPGKPGQLGDRVGTMAYNTHRHLELYYAVPCTGATLHPITIRLSDEPLCLGHRRARIRGERYDELVEAFVMAVGRRFPRAIIQFEDFGKLNAARLLERYQDRARCFNDDIQGTGAVACAGVLSALRISGQKLQDQRVLVVGGGSAGAGIAAMLAGAEIWMFDSKGLVTKDRARGEVAAFARDEPPAQLMDVAKRVRPTILIGVSGQAGIFDRPLLQTMDGPRPIVFPLSNPTAHSECTPEEARGWTQGRAIVATGSPFPDTPQCNNLYIFPGVGLGTLVAASPRVDLEMFRTAARTLAALAPPDQLYPPLRDIRRISRTIAKAVAKSAIDRGLAPAATDDQLENRLNAEIWEPTYLPYRLAK